jgi:UDP-N-acetylglucosamine/UDP-N-acetylgalactosamine diphosphorylase
MSTDSLQQRYADAGQGHLFSFWSKLPSAQQEVLKTQLESLNVERVNRIFTQAVAAEAEALKQTVDDIKPLPNSASESVTNEEKAKEWARTGLDAIARGEVGVLLMAGGQGTRLGSSAPKGCYDIGLPSHKSLFQYQAERIGRLQTVAESESGKAAGSVIIPWYVMTSGPTRRDTEAFFKNNNYFGLDSRNVIIFEQGLHYQVYQSIPHINVFEQELSPV